MQEQLIFNFQQSNISIAMSFGFGVGDFLSVGKLVWDVNSAFADAPEQFRNFSQEILSLHIVIRKVEAQLGMSSSDGMASGSQRPDSGSRSRGGACPWPPSLSTEDQNDLKTLYDGLQAIVKELDDLLQKYKSLESTGNPIDRLKWGREDLDGLRERLRSNINLLTTFNASLAKYVPLYFLLYPLVHRPKLIFGKSSVASSSESRSSLARYLLPGAFTEKDQLHPCTRLPHSLSASVRGKHGRDYAGNYMAMV